MLYHLIILILLLIINCILIGILLVKIREYKLLNKEKKSNRRNQMPRDFYDLEDLKCEVTHRIKNNLQLISSLLNIQAREYNSIEVSEHVNKCQERIYSIILLHENFTVISNKNSVNLESYIYNLKSFVYDVFKINKESISFKCITNKIEIDIKDALPFSLIINELFCNSLKHAFNIKEKGHTISIEINHIEDSSYRLEYCDNGIGFDFYNKPTKGLGCEIIKLLTDQLNGEIEFTSPAKYSIFLNLPNSTLVN